MLLNQSKKCGQSAVELSLIAALVVGVSWSGLQLLSGKMTQGTTAFAGQFSGTPIALSGSSSSSGTPSGSTQSGPPSSLSPTSTIPTATSAPPPITGAPPTTIGTAMPTSPIQTTGSNAYLVSSTLTTSNPTTVSTPTTPSIVTPSGSTVTPVANASSITSVSVAQPAAGDGCMGCAASMTTDLGW